MLSFLKRIEEVSLNAWPARTQILYDGWIVRFSDGYTKRANSVNPCYPSTLDPFSKITRCEKLYSRRGLDAIFRLTPWSSPETLDEHLDQLAYRRIDATWVMHRQVPAEGWDIDPSIELRQEALEDWIRIFNRFQPMSAEQRAAHTLLLRTIPSKRFLMSLRHNGRPVACGLAVLEDRFVGLFDLITAPEERQKGYGSKLLTGLMGLAQSNEAKDIYLQVMESNEIARRLYQRSGFKDLYNYWYRVK